MNPEEMKLPRPDAAEYQAIKTDYSYESDPAEIRIILPRDEWAQFAQKTYVFMAKQATLQAKIFTAQAEMLNAKAEILSKYIK